MAFQILTAESLSRSTAHESRRCRNRHRSCRRRVMRARSSQHFHRMERINSSNHWTIDGQCTNKQTTSSSKVNSISARSSRMRGSSKAEEDTAGNIAEAIANKHDASLAKNGRGPKPKALTKCRRVGHSLELPVSVQCRFHVHADAFVSS